MTNIQHLLVATDLSERSERAVARALRAAQGGRMTALHVVTAGLPVAGFDFVQLNVNLSDVEVGLISKAAPVGAGPSRTNDVVPSFIRVIFIK